MTLSVNAAWVEAVANADPRVRFLIAIYDGTNTWKATSGSMDSGSDLFDVPESVISVSPVANELDPLTREREIGEVVVDVDDAWIRPISTSYRLRGQRLTVKIGAAELNESDFASYFAGPIEDIVPSGDGTVVTLSVLDVFTVLKQKKITLSALNEHPLTVMSTILTRADVDSSLIDSSSLNPAAAANTAIGHFVVSRGGLREVPDGGAVLAPTPAFDLLSEISKLLNGSLDVQEDGKLTFVRFDPSKSNDDVFYDYDIVPGSFKQISDPSTSIVNRVEIKFGRDVDGNKRRTLRIDDSASQSNYKYPGTSGRILAYKFETDWFDANSSLDGQGLGAAGTSFVLWTPELHAFCGTRDAEPGPPPAEATISGTKPAYILLDSLSLPGTNAEVVKADALTIGTYQTHSQIIDPDTGAVTTGAYKGKGTYGTLTRGRFGTGPAKTHVGTGQTGQGPSAIAWDVTILAELGQAILRRFADGIDVIELETWTHKYNLQLGDFVGVVWPHFLAHFVDGLTGSQKFEIIKKEPDFFSSPPKIKWTLASAGEASPTYAGGILGRWQRAKDERLSDEAEERAQNHVGDGLNVTDGGGLTVNIAAGTAQSGWRRTPLDTSVSGLVVQANKDNYVYHDTKSGGVVTKDATIGGAAPASSPTEVLLAVATTDGSGITALKDARVFEGLRGRDLQGDARNQHGVSGDHFEYLPSTWFFSVGALSDLAIVQTGDAGGNAVECDGHVYTISPQKAAFDPSKLYRVRVRVRMTQRDSGSDSAKERFYCGVCGWGADKITKVNTAGADSFSTQHYVCASNRHVFGEVGLNTWVEYTGWFKGRAGTGSSTEQTDPTSPGVLQTNVHYFSPLVICNYNGGDGKMEVDYLVVDVFDEDSTDRTYNAVNPSGSSYTIQANKVITASVANEQLGTIHFLPKTAKRNHNFDFNLFSRG